MSNLQPARISPLPEDEWDPGLDPTRAGFDPVLNVHRVLARHPDLLAVWAPLRHHIASGGSLTSRHRELVILRVASRAGSEYEWHHHVIRAGEAGLSDEEIAAVGSASQPDGTGDEAALLAATDELFEARSISDRTWRGLAAAFTVEQILDLIVTVGVYVTLAALITAAGVQIED